MDQSTHEVRLAGWKTIIQQCEARPEGQSAKQWLRENGITPRKYYYWLRRVRKKAYEELRPQLPSVTGAQPPSPAFVEVPAAAVLPENSSAITIRTRKSTIEISSGVPAAELVKLLKAVSHAL